MKNSLNRRNIIIFAALISVPVMMLFQNCGQAGSLNISDGIAVNADAKSATDTLEIVPPTDNHIIQLERPPLSEEENQMPNQGSGVATSAINSQGSSSNLEPVSGGSSSVGVRHGSHDDDDRDDDKDNESEESEKPAIARCGGLDISDILLKVASIKAHCSKGDANLEIVDLDKSITLDKLTLKVKANKDDVVREVTLVLSQDGNKVLSSNNVAMDLKTPSAHTAGLKVKLSESVSVKAGQEYVLELSIQPEEQIVQNKNKCLFKPIIKDASLNSAG